MKGREHGKGPPEMTSSLSQFFFYHGLKCPLTRRKFQEKSFEDLIQVVSRIKTVYQGDNLASVQNPVERIEKEGRNPAANGLRDKV